MQAFTVRNSDIERCPIRSLSARHYRTDGSCRCGEFELKITRTITIREGWGVDVMAIWAGEGEPEAIVEIHVSVTRITRETCKLVGGAWCVDTGDGPSWVPVENFRELDDLEADDTHDLRTRWFATEREAIEHADTVNARWRNPALWESFVELG